MEPNRMDIGACLRHAREARGMTLRDIAMTTKISTSALGAIERNDFGRLPGGVFRKAYVKAFAVEVGLSADELAREYRAQFEPPTRSALVAEPRVGWFDRQSVSRRMTALVIVIIGLVICALLILSSDLGASGDATAQSYLRRIDIAGSICDARRAGIQQAARPTTVISAETSMSVSGSRGATP